MHGKFATSGKFATFAKISAMKHVFLVLLLAGFGAFYSCRPSIRHANRAVFHTVEPLLRDDTARTGFFTNASLFDRKYDEIMYETIQGDVIVPNDGTQNCLICRYDPATLQPIWIAVGGGKGGDAGCNYYTVPPENAVYVMGHFEGEASFPITAGSKQCKKVVSHGLADMFIAKYSYDKGILQWIASGGSEHADIVFTDNLGARHKETLMTVDSAVVTIYTNFFGPAKFGDKSIEAKLSGSAVQVSYDKTTGKVKNVQFATSLPSFGNQAK